MEPSGSHSDWITGTATVATMLGILTFALFPFALPALVLVVGLGVLLALPVIVLGAVAAILAGVWLGIRAAGRGIGRISAPTRTRQHQPMRSANSTMIPSGPRR